MTAIPSQRSLMLALVEIVAKNRRLYATLVLFSVLPLLLFFYVADRWLRSASMKSLTTQSQMVSDFTAKIIEGKFADTKASMGYVASGKHLLEAYDRNDIQEMTDQSEEHTSELQSRPHLVCRLLL